MELDDTIREAIQGGRSIRVRYFGGASPGAEREIFPLRVKDGKVYARSIPDGTVKAFLLERTELVIEGVSSVLTETLPPPPVTWPTFEEFVAGYADMLRGLGWIVLHEHDDISLHRTYKNGKMVNTPDVRLYFEATTCDLLFDGKTVTETNHRDRQRPWTLRVKKQNPKAFGNFVKAQLAFLEAAKLLAPRKK